MSLQAINSHGNNSFFSNSLHNLITKILPSNEKNYAYFSKASSKMDFLLSVVTDNSKFKEKGKYINDDNFPKDKLGMSKMPLYESNKRI